MRKLVATPTRRNTVTGTYYFWQTYLLVDESGINTRVRERGQGHLLEAATKKPHPVIGWSLKC